MLSSVCNVFAQGTGRPTFRLNAYLEHGREWNHSIFPKSLKNCYWLEVVCHFVDPGIGIELVQNHEFELENTLLAF
jgi:hypothetical protein